MDFQIMLQIIIGDSSTRLRKMVLPDLKLTLNDSLLAGRRAEVSTYQAVEMEKKTDPRKQKCGSCGESFHKQQTLPCTRPNMP